MPTEISVSKRQNIKCLIGGVDYFCMVNREPARSRRTGGNTRLEPILLDLYRDLSLCLEHVRESILHASDAQSQICFTVLEEDLSALVEECEEHIVAPQKLLKGQLASITSRGLTVIEELKALNFH